MKDNKFGLIRFAIAGILCVTSAYFTEKAFGVFASLPITIVLCIAAYFIYKKPIPLIFLCSLGGLIFKAAFTSDAAAIIKSVIICAVLSALSVTSMHLCFGNRRKTTRVYSAGILLLFLSLSIHLIVFGTFFGNLTSKELNENYIRTEYPDVEFTIESTYYSPKDGRYLTDAVFRDKEVYTAQFSAPKGNKATIDGYKDYCEARLLEYGTKRLKSFLESHEHEGENFALRRSGISLADRLQSKAEPEDYYRYMMYDIAFYDVFTSKEAFIERCRGFVQYIPNVFEFNSIRFYGIGNSGSFEYQADFSGNRQLSEPSSFDGKQFETYFSDKDTHKYWSIIK